MTKGRGLVELLLMNNANLTIYHENMFSSSSNSLPSFLLFPCNEGLNY